MDFLKIGLLIFFFTWGVFLFAGSAYALMSAREKQPLRVKLKVVIGLAMLAGCYYYYTHYLR